MMRWPWWDLDKKEQQEVGDKIAVAGIDSEREDHVTVYSDDWIEQQ